MPQFAVFLGLSERSCSQQAELLAKQYKCTALTLEGMMTFSKNMLGRELDPTKFSQVSALLQTYADLNKSAMIVLDRYPTTAEDAQSFLQYFGEPKITVNIEVMDDQLREEAQAKAGD